LVARLKSTQVGNTNTGSNTYTHILHRTGFNFAGNFTFCYVIMLLTCYV
jgi:hypothetical protein